MEKWVNIDEINPNPICTGTGSLIYAFKTDDQYIIKAVEHDIHKQTGKILHRMACQTLENEFEILKDLSHPNIVKFIHIQKNFSYDGHFSCASLAYRMHSDFLTEYVEKDAEPSEIIQNLKKIIESIQYLHEKNITHNDIKPENFFLKQKSIQSTKGDKDQIIREPYLGDFGCAQTQEYNNQFHQRNEWSERNLHYCAPEIFDLLNYKTEKIFDEKKTDIFAMGQSIIMCVFKTDPRINAVPDDRCPFFKHIMTQDFDALWSLLQPVINELRAKWTEEQLKEALDLSIKMMNSNLNERLTAQQSLSHKFFRL